MTAERWEPLVTAEDVVAALKAGRLVQRRSNYGPAYDWGDVYAEDRGEWIESLLADGCEYRALITGGDDEQEN